MKPLHLFFVVLFLSSFKGAALENGLARTPPMGWSGWNAFYGQYNESMVVAVADAMATNGMLAAGYNIISFDVGWMDGRHSDGNPIINTNRFPHGLKWLGDYLHAKGFQFGVYGILGSWSPTNVCEPTGPGHGGSVGYEDIDAAFWASVGADYLKYDLGCTSPNSQEVDHAAMRDALQRTGRPIIYMLSGGYFYPYKQEVANLWRTFNDIYGQWKSVLTNADINCRGARYAKPGAWNDPDMLEVGNNYFTFAEEKSHFALWCIMAAPLIAGNDMRVVPPDSLRILTAPELIAVDQDPAGIQGLPATKQDGLEVWCKPLGFAGTEKAVLLLNRTATNANISVFWTNILLQAGRASVRDLWERTDLGTFTDSFTASVEPHGCVILKVAGASCGPPVYLSDLPFAQLPSLPNTNGAGDVVRDHSVWQGYLQQDTGVYPKGLATVAPSQISFILSNTPGMVTRFVADVGLDDIADIGGVNIGSVVFQVWADGTQLYDSGIMIGSSPSKTINLDLTGKSILTLIVTDAGDGNAFDVADWNDARIMQAPRAVSLTASRKASDICLTWPTDTEVKYQLQSSVAPGTGPWKNEGALLDGTGGPLSLAVPISGAPTKLFRLLISAPSP